MIVAAGSRCFSQAARYASTDHLGPHIWIAIRALFGVGDAQATARRIAARHDSVLIPHLGRKGDLAFDGDRQRLVRV